MSVLRNTLWATLGNWGQQLFAFMTMVIVARLLDPSAFGILTIAMLFILLFQRILLEAFTFGVVRIQIEHYKPDYLDTAFLAALIAGIGLGAGLFYSAQIIARLFDEPTLTPVLQTLSVMPVIEGLGVVHTGILRREFRYKELALRTIGANFMSGVVGITLAYNGAGVWALVSQQLVAAVGSLIALWLCVGWIPGLRWSIQSFKRIVHFATPMLGNAVLFVAANRLDVMAIATVYGPGPTGIYNLSKRILRTITDLIVSGAMNVSLSAFSANQGDLLAQKAFFTKQLTIVSFIAYPLFVGLTLVAEELIPLAFGNQWREAVPVVQILSIFGLIQTIQLLCSNFLIAKGKGKDLFIFNIVSIVVLCIFLIFLLSFGATGAALAFLGQAIVTLPMLIFLMKKQSFVGFTDILNSIINVLIGLTIMSAVVITCAWGWGASLPIVYGLLLKILIGVLVYILFSIFGQRDVLRLVLKNVRVKSRRRDFS